MKSHVGMQVCFICLEPKSILLNTRLKKTLEDKVITDMEPCDECKKHMKHGIILVRANGNKSQFNGTYVVVKEEAVRKIFKGWGQLDAVMDKRIAILEDKVFDEMFKDVEGKGEQDDNK